MRFFKRASIGIIFLLIAALPVHATVASSTSRVKYTCSGGSTFAFTFGVGTTSEIQVIKTVTATNVETTLTETTDYTISATNNDYSSGGTVTTTAACAAGNTLTILRNVPLTQDSDFTEGMPTLYETFEDGLDKLTRITQQQQEEINRAPKLPESFTVTSNPMPEPAANNYLGWNSDATALENKITALQVGATPADSNQTYYVDAEAVDQGDATEAQTIASLLASIGTSKQATIVLAHSGSGNTTTYAVGQNADWSAYLNVIFKIEQGALLSQGIYAVTLSEIVDNGVSQKFYNSGSLATTGTVKLIKNATRQAGWWGLDSAATGAVNAVAVQKAILSSPVGAYGDGSSDVKMHAGSFTAAPDIISTSSLESVTLSGAGNGRAYGTHPPSATYLKFSAGTIGINNYSVAGVDTQYNRFKDFVIDGQDLLDIGIKVAGTAPVLEDFTVYRTKEYGIWLTNAVNMAVLNRVTCTSVSTGTAGYGLYFSRGAIDSTPITVRDSVFSNNKIGVRVEHASILRWEGVNVIESNDTTGLSIYQVTDDDSIGDLDFFGVWFEDNGTAATDYAVIIDRPLAARSLSYLPKNISFRKCRFSSGNNRRYVYIGNGTVIDFDTCTFSGGDNTNGIVMVNSYANKINFKDRQGPDPPFILKNAGGTAVWETITDATTQGIQTTGMLHSLKSANEILWFGIDTITAGVNLQVMRPTAYAIGGLTMAPTAYPMKNEGVIIGVVIWRTDAISAGTITIRPSVIAAADGFGGAVANMTEEGGGAINFNMAPGDGAYLAHDYPIRYWGSGWEGGVRFTAGQKLGMRIDASGTYAHTTNSHTLIGLLISHQ